MTPRYLRMLGLVSLLAWVSLLGLSSAQAMEPYWVDAVANTRLVKAGEPFRFVITAGAQNGYVHLPGKTGVFPECHVLGYKEKDVSKRHEGYLARQGIYRLAAFSLEEVILPTQLVRFSWSHGTTATAQSLPIQIGIRSMYPETGLSLIDPRAPKRASNTVLIVSLSLTMLLLAIWVARGWKRRPKKEQPKPPAHLEAMQHLEALGKSRLVAEATKSDKYFTELSRIIRQYIANRYHFPALEMSRLAIVEELMRLGVEAKRRELINKLLQETDLVKFAQEVVDYRQVAEAHGLAREIIALTRQEEVSLSGKAGRR
jgi:hypothetical protein